MAVAVGPVLVIKAAAPYPYVCDLNLLRLSEPRNWRYMSRLLRPLISQHAAAVPRATAPFPAGNRAFS